MTRILVVDDSAVDRRLAGNFLEKRAGLADGDKATGIAVVYAANGKEGLAAIELDKPDLVLTDMQMPEMGGLQLVEQVKLKYPGLPVIIMTAHGSEEIAIKALNAGAASYVPKRNLAKELLETVEDVLAVAGTKQLEQKLLDECWTQTKAYFRLPNDLAYIPTLVSHLQENLIRRKICDENGLLRIAVALREALSNAVLHGNLEVSSELRVHDERAYYALMEKRKNEEPYEDRYVYVAVEESPVEAVYIIRDEGPGFDPASLPDPTDPVNLERACGRGLLLIRTFMDEVRHNKKGNEITLVKRADRSL